MTPFDDFIYQGSRSHFSNDTLRQDDKNMKLI